MYMNEELKPLGMELNLMERLANTWYISVLRNDTKVDVLLEDLTLEELTTLWNRGFSDDKKNEDAMRMILLWYAIDKLKAHQQFLTTEGYVRV